MRVIVSQQDLPAGRHGKKILVTFKSGKIVDKYEVDKAEDFLVAIDRFIKKYKIRPIGQIGPIKYIEPIGELTERVIRAIIAGLRL